MIKPIKTPRLRLVSLSIECLEALIAGDLDRARNSVPFRMSIDTSLVGQHWMSRRLEMIRKDASHHAWMYRAIVRDEDNEMVGFISCHHGYPDPDLADFSKNGIELGYTIEPQYRRCGYAFESIVGLISWARTEKKEVDTFITVSPKNIPSMKLAEALNFEKIGEHMDEIDGLEYVLRYPKNNEPKNASKRTESCSVGSSKRPAYDKRTLIRISFLTVALFMPIRAGLIYPGEAVAVVAVGYGDATHQSKPGFYIFRTKTIFNQKNDIYSDNTHRCFFIPLLRMCSFFDDA